ncbi:MAG: Msa family membrane protein [Lachnospiraceae bacterium]|nr:Msa family membrane protein [Lachnospiraceae bacterium]
MNNILIAVFLNALCFGMTYMMMPEISALGFLGMVILLPVIYNIVLFIKENTISNKVLSIFVLVTITTISYILFGIFVSINGGMKEFATRNSFSDGNITISISENSNSLSNIIFMMLGSKGHLFSCLHENR